MTDPFSQPYVFPGADRPEKPRPLFGKIFAWMAMVLGTVLVLGSLLDFSIAGVVLGLCAAAAGGVYLFSKPSRGRVIWAAPAMATLPALVAFALVTPSPEPAETSPGRVVSVPSLAEVANTTARPTTSTPTTTRSTTAPTTTRSTTVPPTTLAPTPETVTVYAPPPTTAAPYVPAPDPTPAYVPPPAPVYSPAPFAAVPDAPSSVYYANCSAVRAAGAAPIYAGEPGYSSKLDRDGDGVACE